MDLRTFFFLAAVGTTIICNLVLSVVGEEYCEWEAMNVTCQPDEILVVQAARYGRMRAGRCVTTGYGNLGCSTDVTSYVDRQCSGRRRCYVEVSSLQRLVRPCPKDLKSYLDVRLACVQVFIPKTASCPAASHVLLTQEDGMVASLTTTESVVGTNSCPWLIQVQPYHRLNVTLIEFSTDFPSSSGYLSAAVAPLANQHSCDLLATLSDKNRTNQRPLCAQNRRYSSVLITQSNQLEIRFNPKAAYSRFFAIKYEAIGCVPIQAPSKAFVLVSGDHVTVHCNETDEAWFLTCRGRHWIGQLDNCSSHAYAQAKKRGDTSWSMNRMVTSVFNFPLGVLVVVSMGVVVGVAMGVFMLIGVLTYMKRQRQCKIRSQSEYVLSDVDADDEMEKHRQLHQYATSQLQCRGGGGASDLSIIDTPMLSDTSGAWPGQRRSLPHNLRKAPPSLHNMLMSSTYRNNTHSPYEQADDDNADHCHPDISMARSLHSLYIGQGQGHIRNVNSIVYGRERERETMTSPINDVINTSSDDISAVPVADTEAIQTTFATFRVVSNNRPSHTQTTSTSNVAPRSGGRKRKMILTFLPAANNEQLQQQQQQQDNATHQYKLLDPSNLERDHDHCHGNGGLFRPDVIRAYSTCSTSDAR